jgi:hypothetical protein
LIRSTLIPFWARVSLTNLCLSIFLIEHMEKEV